MLRSSATAPGWNPWPVSIIAFFAIAVLGFASFIWFCSRHPVDLVAADYYDQELRYQRQIDHLQNAEQFAASTTVAYDRAAQMIIISFPTSALSATSRGIVQLYRPSAAKRDQAYKLAPGSDGVQRINAAGLSAGLWRVRISWTADKKEFFLERKVVVESQAS